MKKRSLSALLLFSWLVLTFSCDEGSGSKDQNGISTAAGAPVFKLEQVANNVVSPVALTHACDSSGRLFIVEQPGRILIWKAGKVSATPFLDLTSTVVPLNNAYSEMGLLGLAFHPQYRSNGRFFIYYSTPSKNPDSNHTTVLAEYKVSAGNPDQADPKGKVLLTFEQPESNHNGGCLAFGPDGMLYLSLGDGGGAGDQHGKIGNAQNLEELLGSIIRLDVNKASPYAIPDDNPFVGKPGRDEIYASGLRNPWRFSFDRQTGQLFCGDVGQNKYEEIDIIEKGRNYGWRPMEASHVYDETLRNQLKGLYTDPIAEYDHSLGTSVTGGYVYRGRQFPALAGKYLFADWSGRLLYLEKAAGKWTLRPCRLPDNDEGKVNFRINSFGEDEAGELYVVAQRQTGANSPSGVIFKIGLQSEK